MVFIPVEELRELGIEIFKTQGASEERARFLVETLVEANLTGHDSHGVHYYVMYSERIEEGHIKVD